MLNIQKTYAREVDGKYEVFSSYLSAEEIELEDGEYYAIIIDADEYSNRDDEIEINAHIVEYEKNHLGNFEYIFLYSDYQSYAYELADLEDEEDY
jgi:hypothetical protein